MENLLVALLSFTLLASTSAVRIIGGSTPTIARGSGARMGVLENPAAPVLSGENLQDCLSRALDASPRKHIALLGSTGSIGTQTLDICREYPEAFEVISISAGANVELLAQQAIEFKPKVVGLAAAEKEAQLRELISAAGAPMPEIVTGPDGQIAAAVAPGADTVVTGVVGVAGLFPTIEAIKLGRTIALANKETLIAGGPVILPLLTKHGAKMTPADSEHSAIFQCLQARAAIRRNSCGAIRRNSLTRPLPPSAGRAAGRAPPRDPHRERRRLPRLFDRRAHRDERQRSRVHP